VDTSLSSAIASQYPSWRSLRTASMVNAIADLLADRILDCNLAGDLFIGVGTFSNFTPQVSRYTRLGTVCKRVFIYGVADVSVSAIPGVEFIQISPESPLAKERFFALNSPEFWAVLLAEEIKNTEQKSDDLQLQGGIIYDEQVVEQISQQLLQVAQTEETPVITRNCQQQNVHMTEMEKSLLERLEVADSQNKRRGMQLGTLHQFAAILSQHQPLPCTLQEVVKVLGRVFGATESAIALNLQGSQFTIFKGNGKVSIGQHLLAVGNGPSSQALYQGKLIGVSNAYSSNHSDTLMPLAESILAAPIVGRRRTHGVVTVGSQVAGAWNEEDSQTIAAIASLLAVIIEQKASVTGDIVLQLRRARQLEHMLAQLRKPMAKLLHLQEKLQDQVDLLPIQQELMAEVEALYTEVAKTIWSPKRPPSFHDSTVSPPPKTTRKLSPEARTP
jgi:putative methionine-R-sulfoxide reductase with GAF domain